MDPMGLPRACNTELGFPGISPTFATLQDGYGTFETTRACGLRNEVARIFSSPLYRSSKHISQQSKLQPSDELPLLLLLVLKSERQEVGKGYLYNISSKYLGHPYLKKTKLPHTNRGEVFAIFVVLIFSCHSILPSYRNLGDL